MSLHRKIFVAALATTLLFVSCSRKNARTVTTRDGRTIKFKKVALAQKFWIGDSKTGTFELETTGGTIGVPRDFKGIKSFEVLRVGLSPSEFEEQEKRLRKAADQVKWDSLPRYGEPAADAKARKQAAEESYQKWLAQNPPTGSSYSFRITFDSGNVLEGEVQVGQLPDWGYLIGRTEIPGGLEGDMQIPLSQVLTVIRE